MADHPSEEKNLEKTDATPVASRNTLREILNSKATQWAVGLIVIVFISPFVNAVWLQKAQYNADRAQVYHDSVTQFYKLKTAVWEASAYCKKTPGALRDAKREQEYMNNIDTAESLFLEKSPGINIEYYFTEEVTQNTVQFITWLNNHKNEICTPSGSNENIYKKIKTEWSRKIYNPMKNEMYRLNR